jgi:hypothetical protein
VNAACPQCQSRRLGSFRYCRSCGFDFEAPPPPPHPLDGAFEPFDLLPNVPVPARRFPPALLAFGIVLLIVALGVVAVIANLVVP